MDDRDINQVAETETAPTAGAGRLIRPPGLCPPGVCLILVLGALLRLWAGWVLGPGNDEAIVYYLSRFPSLSYYSHPPLNYWLAALSGQILGQSSFLCLRLIPILLFTGSTWLMYLTSRRMFGPRAGFYAALLFSLSPFFLVGCGIFILPDGPMVFLGLVCLWILLPLLLEPEADRPPSARPLLRWSLAGFFLGLALLSKYPAVFFAAGLLIYLLTTRQARPWLLHPGPYLAALIALLVFSPVLIWNQQHDWISFTFQGGRVGSLVRFSLIRLLAYLGGQALYFLPWIWGLQIYLLYRYGLGRRRDQAVRLCLSLALVPVLFFPLVYATGGAGLLHWAGPGFLFLFPPAGRFLARAEERGQRWPSGYALVTAAVVVAGAVLLVGHTSTGWLSPLFRAGLFDRLRESSPGVMKTLTQGFRLHGKTLDPTLGMLEFKELAQTLDTLMAGRDRPTFIISTDWMAAVRIAWALRARYPVLCFSGNPQHLALIPHARGVLGTDAVYVRLTGSGPAKPEDFAGLFESSQVLPRVEEGGIGAGNLVFDLILYQRMNRLYENPRWPGEGRWGG